MSDKNSKIKTDTKQIETTKNPSAPSRIRWGESYVSLLLGALVVIIAAALGFSYVKIHQPKQELLPPATISRNLKLTITPVISKEKRTDSNQKMENSFASGIKKTNNGKSSQGTYIVQKNDSLWSIAEKIYGSGYSWISIERANNLSNPGMIFSGNILIIPSVTPILVQKTPQQILPTLTPVKELKPTLSPNSTAIATLTPTPSVISRNAITESIYTVQSGDSLWSIAIRAYGQGNRWGDIAKANSLANPSVIHSGNVLKIPHQ